MMPGPHFRNFFTISTAVPISVAPRLWGGRSWLRSFPKRRRHRYRRWFVPECDHRRQMRSLSSRSPLRPNNVLRIWGRIKSMYMTICHEKCEKRYGLSLWFDGEFWYALNEEEKGRDIAWNPSGAPRAKWGGAASNMRGAAPSET